MKNTRASRALASCLWVALAFAPIAAYLLALLGGVQVDTFATFSAQFRTPWLADLITTILTPTDLTLPVPLVDLLSWHLVVLVMRCLFEALAFIPKVALNLIDRMENING